ncbi:MAG TPA: ATPase, T2SS/T4P/T4SS family, partial [Gemmataceae bacterium]|nr:ATPase, T2SS/T4P/T4SS family [Gemmataceae bacterium]
MTAPNDQEPAIAAAEEFSAALWIDVASSDVPFVVAGLLEHACGMGVSDMFICAEELYCGISARHLGLWQPMSQVSTEMGKRCLAHIKSIAGMDIAERRRPLDGRWIFQRSNGETVDLRLSTIPTLHGEDCTIRFLLRGTQLLSLDKLGMLQRDHNCLLKMLNNPSGLILVTGPTGSGKTTTL